LGDIIHGLRVAATIRHCLPQASIDWVVSERFADIVEATGIIKNIFLFHRGGGLRKFIALICEVRKFHYDYVFDMQGLARSGVIAHFSRGNKKIGRSDSREFAWLAYDEKIPLPPGNTPHAIDILLQFLPKLGLPATLQFKLSFSGNLGSETRNSLPTWPLQKRPVIIIFPESRRKEKEWPHFADLTVALANKFPKLPILIAGHRNQKIEQSFSNIHNLSGKTSVVDIAHLIQHADIAVTNDSAPMHIADAVGTPVLALFGPTDPRRFGPYPINNKKNIILLANGKNLASITVEKVLHGIEAMATNWETFRHA
jgi:ADP-heptose:LPS heptosyltransferase